MRSVPHSSVKSDGLFSTSNRGFLFLLALVLLFGVYTFIAPAMHWRTFQLQQQQQQPCQCNCNCGDKSVANEPASTSNKMLALRAATTAPITIAASAVSDAALISAWSPQYVQTYQPVPHRVKTSHHQFVRAAYPPVGPERGSLFDASFLDTPIAYGTPLVPQKDRDGFPEGFVPRPACQKETDILQNYIYENQHPGDCKTKKLFVRRHLPGYGQDNTQHTTLRLRRSMTGDTEKVYS